MLNDCFIPKAATGIPNSRSGEWPVYPQKRPLAKIWLEYILEAANDPKWTSDDA
jgi:hypothetical protein